MYDVAIVGTGPAGISAALNLKLYKKDIIWFGTPALSDKVQKSEKIANYPGASNIGGPELNQAFKKQIEEMDLVITDKIVTNITEINGYFMLMAGNDIFEAKTVLLATGSVGAKGLKNEQELLGQGVSYCATCDGFLYKDKTIGVYCGSKKYEHEVEYLSKIAKQVYIYCGYKDSELNLPNVTVLTSPVREVLGDERVTGIKLTDGTEIEIEGMFFLRNAVAPAMLLKGLELDGPNIVVDKHCKTNKAGCFAAGDCTGRPYQLTVATGEGNIAAHSIIEYLAGR
jgi:thioredoxin reductase (NADPH)